MADPLSIAASVTGMLAVAAKICSVVSGFVDGVANAPDSVLDIWASVEDMRRTLVSVKQIMDKVPGLPRDRREMIHISHLIITFRECIQSLSELESRVDRVCSGAWDRVKWAIEENNISRSVQRIQAHKVSLGLMLSILQCESDAEARECLGTLQESVQRVFDQNETLLRRLEQHNFYCSADERSMRFFDDDQSTVRCNGNLSAHPTMRDEGVDDAAALETPIALEQDTPFAGRTYPREFEITLEQTRVYSRVRPQTLRMRPSRAPPFGPMRGASSLA